MTTFNQISSKNQKLNLCVFCSSFIAAMSLFVTGYNFGSLAISTKYIYSCSEHSASFLGLANCVEMKPEFWSRLLSIISVGGFFGSFLAIYLSYNFGRKHSLLYNNIGFVAGGLLLSLSNHKLVMLTGRFIIGVSAGISMTVVPMYIAEIATIKTKGKLGLLTPILTDLGNICALVLSLGSGTLYSWRILLGTTVLISVLQFFCMCYCVETPRFLLLFKKEKDKGLRNLKKIRKGYNVKEEMEEIMTNSHDFTNIETNQISALKLLFSRCYRKRVTLSLFILAGQGLSGISAIDYYSQQILERFYPEGLSSFFVILAVFLGASSSLFTSFYVDTIGRKFFLIISQIGVSMACLMLATGTIYKIDMLVLAGIFSVRIFYGVGLSGIPYIVASELFPTYLVSGGNGIVSAACWISHYLVADNFSGLQTVLGKHVFIVFVIFNILSAIVTHSFLPETKGKSIEEIDDMFINKKT